MFLFLVSTPWHSNSEMFISFTWVPLRKSVQNVSSCNYHLYSIRCKCSYGTYFYLYYLFLLFSFLKYSLRLNYNIFPVFISKTIQNFTLKSVYFMRISPKEFLILNKEWTKWWLHYQLYYSLLEEMKAQSLYHRLAIGITFYLVIIFL